VHRRGRAFHRPGRVVLRARRADHGCVVGRAGTRGPHPDPAAGRVHRFQRGPGGLQGQLGTAAARGGGGLRIPADDAAHQAADHRPGTGLGRFDQLRHPLLQAERRGQPQRLRPRIRRGNDAHVRAGPQADQALYAGDVAAAPVDGEARRARAAAAPPAPATPGTVDDVVATVETSTELAASQSLARRLQRIDGLEGVTVTVRDGVARLDGQVIDVEDRVLAAQIASQQPGVEAVENQVELSTRLSDRFDAAVRQVTGKLVRLLAATPLLAVALAIVGLAWWVGRWLGRRARVNRLGEDNPYLDGLVRRLVQWIVLLIGVLIALDLLGATALVGAVLGSAGVLGLVLGFAFK